MLSSSTSWDSAPSESEYFYPQSRQEFFRRNFNLLNVVWKDLSYFYHKSKFWFEVFGGKELELMVKMDKRDRDRLIFLMRTGLLHDPYWVVEEVLIRIPGLDFRGLGDSGTKMKRGTWFRAKVLWSKMTVIVLNYRNSEECFALWNSLQGSVIYRIIEKCCSSTLTSLYPAQTFCSD